MTKCIYTELRRSLRKSAIGIFLFLGIVVLSAETIPSPVHSQWPDAIAKQLSEAGTNQEELVQALNKTPDTQQAGMRFLVENMPLPDLRALSSVFLLENIALAYQARAETSWGKNIPEDIFNNDVLPYASLDERRGSWRKKLHDICLPLINDCTSPGEAAHRLNQKLFPLVQVKYSTSREKPQQNPLETMASGVATCTGLSILLVDACRSVGVPARIAGTPMWANGSGNHTWVEVWDQTWHFLGAAEPDPKGLDQGWFEHNASQALRDNPTNAIYASSYKITGLSFPLVWAPETTFVPAWNVTGRYAAKAAPAANELMRLLVRVNDHPAGKRVEARIRLTRSGKEPVELEGISRGETADLNDDLSFQIPKGQKYAVQMEKGNVKFAREYKAGTNAEDVVTFCLGPNPDLTSSPIHYEPQKLGKPLNPGVQRELSKELSAYFMADERRRTNWHFSARFERQLRDHEAAVRQLAWQAYATAPIHDNARRDFETKVARFGDYLSPYTLKTVGARPTNGWPLFIAMHGGGNAPKEVNDSQWKVMQRYYRDHPELGGYQYVALRAPNDTWNGFYDNYVYPLVGNLIRHFLLFGDVDPNKVFIMGYSHGGYGAFAIGPKMPDRFAAIHASAAAPTDGETTATTLRNTVFTFMVGGKDTMYGRLDRCVQFNKDIQQLRGGRMDTYPVTFQLIDGNGHTGLPDRDKIVDMYPQTRNPVPRELTWLMTDDTIHDFFWLHVNQPAKKCEFDATCRDNRLTVTLAETHGASVLLDSRLIDFNHPLRVVINGKSAVLKLRPSLRVLCQSLMERGDPELAFTAKIDL